MTSDQASELRLRMKAMAGAAPEKAAPRLIAVLSGIPGVGATTIAANLAVEMARHGRRVAVLAATAPGGLLARYCGAIATNPGSLTEALAGRCSLSDVLHQGPQGLMTAAASLDSPDETDRLATQAKALDGLEFVLFDAGVGTANVAQVLAHAADEVVVVLSPSDAAIMESYAAIKLLCGQRSDPRVRAVVNRAVDAEQSADALARLARGCQRFLGLSIEAFGHVPDDNAVADALSCGTAVVSRSPRSAAARALRHMAEAWLRDHVRLGWRGGHAPSDAEPCAAAS